MTRDPVALTGLRACEVEHHDLHAPRLRRTADRAKRLAEFAGCLRRGHPGRRRRNALGFPEPQDQVDAASVGAPVVGVEVIKLPVGRRPQVAMPLAFDFDGQDQRRPARTTMSTRLSSAPWLSGVYSS